MGRRGIVVNWLVVIGAVFALSLTAHAQQGSSTKDKATDSSKGKAVTPQNYDFGRIRTDPVPGQEIRSIRHKTFLKALPEKRITPKKTAAGWPDLQGNWSVANYIGQPTHNLETGFDPAGNVIEGTHQYSTSGGVGWPGNVLIDPMNGVVPYQPWAKEKHLENLANLYAPTKRIHQEPTDLCFMGGVPRDRYQGGQIRYAPPYVVFLREKGTQFIPMDARPPLNERITLFMGDSRGHWEGDTLVVETRNNRISTWFDVHGTHHSDKMRVIERYTLVDENTMYHEITIDDPTVFTQVWKMATTFDREKETSTETEEYQCHESERDMDPITRAGIRANAAGLKGYHIHLDLKTGKALRPEEQQYLDRGQVPFHSFAPAVPDEMLIGKTCDGCPRPK